MSTKAIRLDDHDPDRNLLVVDLHDILMQFEPEARVSMWRISGAECTGPAADKVHGLSDAGVIATGEQLVHLSRGILQTIDGTFEAFWPSESLPWIVIEAVDSSFFVITTNSQQLLDRLRASFREVSDAEPWDEPLSAEVRPLQSK